MQNNFIKSTLEMVWITLVLLTLFAFLLGCLNYISPLVISVLLLSTFIKGQLVIDYFMGLKDVKLLYRLIPSIWLLIVIALIATAYYLPV